MRNFKLGFIFLMVLVSTGLYSCLEDEDPQPIYYSAWSNMYTIGDVYYATTDGGLVLKMNEFDDSDLQFEENDRVVITFTIEEENTGGIFDYLVNLEQLYYVEEGDLVALNENSRDTIGNGYVQLSAYPLVGGDYLNLELVYEQEEGDHVFSLCYDETIQEEGEPVILELRNYYPEENDDDEYVAGLYSFNISQLQMWSEMDEDNVIEFTLRINSGDSQEQDFNLEYEVE